MHGAWRGGDRRDNRVSCRRHRARAALAALTQRWPLQKQLQKNCTERPQKTMPGGPSNAVWEEQFRKEFFAEVNAKGRDPLATTLADLIGGLPEDTEKKRAAAAAAAAAPSGSRRGSSQLSAVSASKKSQLSGSQLSAAAKDKKSQLSKVSRRSQRETGDDDEGLSMLSMRTPSSIRSSEPSAIARNKIAELQLRLELERVLRMEKEMEVEQQRKELLLASKGSSKTLVLEGSDKKL